MAVAVKLPDVGQGHAVEGVVFAGGVDGHVSKENQVAFLQFVFKGVVSHYVSRQTGWSGQTEGMAHTRLGLSPQDGRLVGHLQYVGHVTSSTGVQNGNLDAAVFHDVQYPADQVACVTATASGFSWMALAT